MASSFRSNKITLEYIKDNIDEIVNEYCKVFKKYASQRFESDILHLIVQDKELNFDNKRILIECLSNYCDIDQLDKNNMTPLDYAIQIRDENLINLIRKIEKSPRTNISRMESSSSQPQIPLVHIPTQEEIENDKKHEEYLRKEREKYALQTRALTPAEMKAYNITPYTEEDYDDNPRWPQTLEEEIEAARIDTIIRSQMKEEAMRKAAQE